MTGKFNPILFITLYGGATLQH